MIDKSSEKKVLAVSASCMSAFLGFIAGSFVVDSVNSRYSKKGDFFSCAKTEIINVSTVITNGDTLTKKVIIPARVVPEKMILNVQP